MTPLCDTGLALALGTFDGVHLGHRAILEACGDLARSLGVPGAAWTFSRRPGDFLGEAAGCLCTLEEKERLIRETGIRRIVSCDFAAVRDLSPAAFCQKILLKKWGARGVVCGFDFCFGKGAAGDASFLKDYLSPRGVQVKIVEAVRDGAGEKISSTAVRRALKEGQMDKAAALLGRPYSLTLPVLRGKGLGKTLGFATANQLFPADHAPLKHGVYAVKAVFEGASLPGVCNLGVRPSFDDGSAVTVETHLFDFHRELYGQVLKVEFYAFLREEISFASPRALEAQVERDKERAKAFFAQ